MKHCTRSPISDPRGGASIIGRRQLAGLAAGGVSLALLAGCEKQKWTSIDISGSLPRLAFTMTRVEDGKEVTQSDYRGQIALLYFGYTNCPDVCPTTLSDIGDILKSLGPDAEHVHMLFVTVDPNRDTAEGAGDLCQQFQQSDRRVARYAGSVGRIGAALPCALLGDPGELDAIPTRSRTARQFMSLTAPARRG